MTITSVTTSCALTHTMLKTARIKRTLHVRVQTTAVEVIYALKLTRIGTLVNRGVEIVTKSGLRIGGCWVTSSLTLTWVENGHRNQLTFPNGPEQLIEWVYNRWLAKRDSVIDSMESLERTERTLHVIPVPEGMTVEEAWEEIRLLGCLSTENQNKPIAGWAAINDERES